LRRWLAEEALDGLIVPRTDEYLGEYVSADAERLAWVSGFTGSAGTLLILPARAVLFVDGRYTLQAAAEVAGSGIEVQLSSDKSLSQFIAADLAPTVRLAYDPWLHSADQAVQIRKGLEKGGGRLVAVAVNPIDALWTDRPPPPLDPVELYPLQYSGRDWRDKVKDVADGLARDRLDAAILTDPNSVAWLLNLRGRDVPFTPLPLGRAVIHADGRVQAFFRTEKLNGQVTEPFGASVGFDAPDRLGAVLDGLGQRRARVRVDAQQSPAAVVERLEAAGAVVDRGADPCAMPRACKNSVEMDGIKAAHRRDGASLVRFMAWAASHALAEGADELAVVDKAEAVRASNPRFQGLSFATIAGFGPNGAIVHYRSTPATNRPLAAGGLLLLDSGAQYSDGTTDVTRTILIGPPENAGAEQRRRYTQVLKGNIAVSRAVFPEGTSGSQLDALARMALWADGVDYEHGTGHGVGCYLSVHEGPQRISKAGNSVALRPGMVLSNEPGYYKTGHYGIRIETLLAVVRVEAPLGSEKSLLGFEVLTLAPFDRALIDRSLLTMEEVDWVNAYHARVAQAIGPLLDGEAGNWLASATRPL
jgi:Xaa-Pro aminopeptidase